LALSGAPALGRLSNSEWVHQVALTGGRGCGGAKWAITGKQNWRSGLNRERGYGAKGYNNRSQKVCLHYDSRAVAMEVGIS